MSEQPFQFQRSAEDDNKDVDPKDLYFLAHSMAQDEGMTILRRFDELNILNLLVLQDEIQSLGELLKDMCRPNENDADEISPGYLASYVINRKPYTSDAPQRQEKDTKVARRAELWRFLQGRLKEYNSCILEMAQLRNLDPPDPTAIARLKRELKDLAAASKLTP